MEPNQTPVVAPPPHVLTLSTLTDDEVIALTRGVRVDVVADLMTGGKVSGDNSDRILLTNMLNGLDSQANASKRLKADNKAANNSAALIAAVLAGVNKNEIFTIEMPEGDVDPSRTQIGMDIPTPDAVPGELATMPPQQDVNSFLRSQGKDADSLGSNSVVEESEDEF